MRESGTSVGRSFPADFEISWEERCKRIPRDWLAWTVIAEVIGDVSPESFSCDLAQSRLSLLSLLPRRSLDYSWCGAYDSSLLENSTLL